MAASFHFNISLTPDRIILLLLLAALATGRVRLFLRDWSVFLVVLISWQVLTGFSHAIGNFQPHVMEMIRLDRFLFFGRVPTIWLQDRLASPGHFGPYDMLRQQRWYYEGPVHWYDVAATVLYLMHFVFPMLIAFALWLWKRPIFLEFMGSFLIVALSGFATFVLFPAAPPWIAGNWFHVLPHVHRILQSGIDYFGGQASFSALYLWLWNHGGWDVYGAVPSEHAAFPFLCFLYARKAWPRAGWLALPYCMGVWIAVVYLGEHYVADVLAGIAYATAGYAVVHVVQLRRARTSEAAAQMTSGRSAISDSLTA